MNCAKTLRFPLLALVAGIIMAIPASASDLAWTVTNPDSWGSSSNMGNFADVFTVNSNETLNAIGIPVPPVDGYGGGYSTYVNVGLFDSSNNELVDNIVLNPFNITQSGGYFWVTTAPIALSAGQTYTVVVYNNGSNPAYGYSTTAPFTTSGWATFDSSEFLAGSPGGVVNPTSDNTKDNNFFDIGMEGSSSTVPEPESLLLLGSGLIGMAGFLRFKRRKQ